MAVIGVGLFGWIVPNSIVWLVVCVLFAVSEAMTAGLVTIWFALGAFVASIVSIFTDNFLVQLTIFVVVSVISLVYTCLLYTSRTSRAAKMLLKRKSFARVSDMEKVVLICFKMSI